MLYIECRLAKCWTLLLPFPVILGGHLPWLRIVLVSLSYFKKIHEQNLQIDRDRFLSLISSFSNHIHTQIWLRIICSAGWMPLSKNKKQNVSFTLAQLVHERCKLLLFVLHYLLYPYLWALNYIFNLVSLILKKSLKSEREIYFTTGGIPPISSSWRQAPWDHDQYLFSTEHLWS
jgi:amino acid permease